MTRSTVFVLAIVAAFLPTGESRAAQAAHPPAQAALPPAEAAPPPAHEPDPAGLLNGTFSICAIDRKTGESGVAVTTRVPFVGRAVPWVRAGVGAAATQAWTVVEYGPRALDLIQKKKLAPEEVIRRLLTDDRGRERRQIGVIDMQGRSHAFTGSENGAWAGSRQGPDYTVQGNLLVGKDVIDAVADRFESTAGTGMRLAERLILALEAGQKAGGDRRRGELQSAAIRIADPRDPGRAGDFVSLAIDVGEHAEPVQEMKRVYLTTQHRLGWRAFSAIEGEDVVELKRMLQATGHFRPGGPPVPELPEPVFDRSLVRSDPEKLRAIFDEFSRQEAVFFKDYGTFDEETIAAVDAFRREHALAHPGHPRGLVDAAFVEALHDAFQSAMHPRRTTP